MNAEDTAEGYKFPRAGSLNAQSALKMIEFTLGLDRAKISDSRVLRLDRHLTEDYPACEYVVRVGWTPEGDL
jgi:hypothetical protein